MLTLAFKVSASDEVTDDEEGGCLMSLVGYLLLAVANRSAMVRHSLYRAQYEQLLTNDTCS